MALTKLGPGAFPAGTILQTQRTKVESAFTISLGTDTYTTVTGMTVNITPSFSNSIILLTAQIMGEHTHPHNMIFTFLEIVHD